MAAPGAFSQKYKRDPAVAYANRYCENPNTNNYPFIDCTGIFGNPCFDCNGNDCTDFASQVLYAGGLPMDGKWWLKKKTSSDPQICSFSQNGFGCCRLYKYSAAWVNVDALHDYLLQNKLAYQCNVDQVQTGDIIQYHNPSDGWHHSAIVVSFVLDSFYNPIGDFGVVYHSVNNCQTTDSRLLHGDNNDKRRYLCITY